MKVAITINIDQLKRLMLEYIHERGDNDSLMKTLTLSEFLLWLRMKENTDVEEATPSLASAEADRTIG